jgi:hypothetical protein
MHCLEHILFMTSIAVEKGEITMSELAEVLMKLASDSHDYEPIEFTYPDPGGPRNRDEMLVEMNSEWISRFGHLLSEKNNDQA